MKKTYRGFFIAVAACVVAAATFAVASTQHVADTVIASCRAFKNLLVESFMALAIAEPGKPEAVPFVRAKSFALRIAKRERPMVTSSWRLCPSI